MTPRRCLMCGSVDHVVEHHPTTRLLDDRLVVELCHDHHMLVHDDWHAAGVGPDLQLDNFLECMHLRLSRLAMLFYRLHTAGWGGEFVLLLAVSFARWADQMRLVIEMLDAFHGPRSPAFSSPWRQPGWREAPGMDEVRPS